MKWIKNLFGKKVESAKLRVSDVLSINWNALTFVTIVRVNDSTLIEAITPTNNFITYSLDVSFSKHLKLVDEFNAKWNKTYNSPFVDPHIASKQIKVDALSDTKNVISKLSRISTNRPVGRHS